MSSKQSNNQSSPHLAAFLPEGSRMGELIRSMDWSETQLGPIESWPQSLKTTVSLCLASNFPMNIIWGPERIQIYNDGYWPVCGAKHPRSMGQDFKECWLSAWPAVGEPFETASDGETAYVESQRMFLDRNGYFEETFFTFSFSPIRDERGEVAGLFHPVTEMTQQILTERRLGVLRDLADRAVEAKTIASACELVVQTLDDHGLDLPFALIYLLDTDGTQATLAGSAGLAEGSPVSPETVDLSALPQPFWPFDEVVRDRKVVQVDDIEQRFGPLRCGPYPESPGSAFVLPINVSGMEHPFALLVAGVSSRRALDDPYTTFYLLLREAVTNALTNAQAYEAERRRAEVLAEIDRAKTAFFSNVSHEFRTPLTLMLGPVEEMLRQDGSDLSPSTKTELEVVYRNSLRLLKLVNTMLDFSRIESGRIQASYEPVNLSEYTAELVSVFRSAIERAGLRLIVDCPPLPEPAYIDRDMWEKIVLNLISNAFKFTLEGEIEVRVETVDGQARLSVRDTGVGIPEEEMSRIFERFHRVRDSRGHTYEGTGIGLALVQELVNLHGGGVNAESVLDEGSRFTVSVPLGNAHLDPARIESEPSLATTRVAADAYVQEALRWLPGVDQSAVVKTAPDEDASRSRYEYSEPNQEFDEQTRGARIIWVDDNADMREYVSRLLSEQFEVEVFADGQSALDAVSANPPELVLADVMMPGLDGFGLLRAIRKDPQLQETPVILLSARAGEEASVEGLEAGADGYLIKPFSARELLARVESHVKMARMRRKAEADVRANEIRTRNMFRQAPGIMCILNGPTHVFEFVNDAYIRFVGDRELLGKPVHEAIPEAKEQGYIELLDKVFRTGEPVIRLEAPIQLRRKPGGSLESSFIDFIYQPITDASNEVTGIFVEGFDVTNRVQDQKALKESEERYRMLFNSIDEGFCVIQVIFDQDEKPVDYVFLEINPSFEGQTGLKDAAGKRMRELEPRHEEHWFQLYGRIALTGKPERFTNEAKHPGGRWYDVYAFRVGLPEEYKVAVLFRDVTEQKRLETVLRQMNEMLEQRVLERTAELEALTDRLRLLANELTETEHRERRQLAEIIHDDLQQLLVAARIQVNVMRSSESSEPGDLAASLLDQAIEQARTLTVQLRPPALYENGIISALKWLAGLMNEMHGLNVQLDLDADAEPDVDQGAALLFQSVRELLLNAAKYAGVTEARVTMKKTEGDMTLISVEDKGKGFDVAALEARAPGSGGFGLFSIRERMHAMGGECEIRSAPGKGTTALLYVPIGKKPKSTSEQGSAIADETDSVPGPGSKQEHPDGLIRVVIADDHSMVRQGLAGIVESAHDMTVVREVADGRAALEAAVELRPHIVIMDVNMPGMNGIQATRAIKETAPGIEIIGLSIHTDEAIRQAMIDAGAKEYHPKDGDAESLISSIRTLAGSAKPQPDR